MNQSQAIRAFEKFSLPGMALDLNPENTAKFTGSREPAPGERELRPIVKRCACGKRISERRRQCNACYQAWCVQVRPEIAKQLDKMDPEKREAALLGLPENLRPDLPEGYEYGFDMIENRPVIRKK